MEYLWLKAFHIAAVVTWIGGMLTVAVTLASVRGVSDQQKIITQTEYFERVRRWDRYVTSPAMILAWALGLVLAIESGAFQEGWIMAKLPLVLVLSAIHGALTGKLRRLPIKPEKINLNIYNYSGFSVFFITSIVIIIVVVKPF